MPSPDPRPLAPEHRRLLLELARAAIRAGLGGGLPAPPELAGLPPELAVRQASFVTLKLEGRLRGCIGRLRAARPLALDVAHNAYAAAFLDFRFPPVTAAEFGRLDLTLSLLTRPEPIGFASEAELIARLVPGRDGLILERGTRCGTFLPDMWETFPEPATFLGMLERKAGLPPESAGLKAYRYRTERIHA